LTGKFGARHRAALGISEATDSVTVVCSEETGRISIAYNGKMESVRRDEFMIVFKDYMTK
jgi:diadenylate cyclase